MNIRKFTAANTHDATRLVREALGREAMIIANRKTADGVEIIATDNLDDLNADLTGLIPDAEVRSPARSEPAAKRARQSKKKSAKASAGKSAGQASAAVTSVGNAGDQNLHLQREIADLHGALEGLARSGALTMTTNISEVTLAGRLMGCGLGSAMVQQLVEMARPITDVETAWGKSLKNIKKQLRFKPGDFITEGGTYFLHGSAGSGKTTAICKLAMEFLTTNTAGKLAIVTCGENNSLGYKDSMLSAFSQLVHLPVHHAKNAAELEHVLRQLRRKKLILIDTPAIETNDLTVINPSAFGHLSKRQVEHCLVVSASIQGGLLDHLFACLAETPIESLILTRVDETRQIGVSIDSILRSGLQLRYCSDTPDLHCMLHSVSTEVLMARLSAFNPLSTEGVGGRSGAKNGPAPVANWLESAILG